LASGARASRRLLTVGLVAAALFVPLRAYGLIDPDRPVSWLVGECKVIAALQIAAVGKNSATFTVVRVLKGELRPSEITIHWTDIQQPPVERGAIGAPAVLLVPRDEDDPTLVQVSPEYLSLKPDKGRAGEYEFLRLNGFVKGSFNGEAADLIRLIDDTLHNRAYFPIWADTSFASARKIGDLPDAAGALSVGDMDGDGGLDIVAATPHGLTAFTPDGKGGFSSHPLKGIEAADVLEAADADGDGRSDLLTGSGLFLNKGGWQFTPAPGLAGKTWSEACFCFIPGRPTPSVAALESGRPRFFARDKQGAWTDISVEMDLDKCPDKLAAIGVCLVADRLEIVLVSPGALTCLEVRPGMPLAAVQSIPLPALSNPRLSPRDLDGDGMPDVFVAADGVAKFFRRLDNRMLVDEEVPDYLGDVRKMFQDIRGCTDLICEDSNNDGLVDLMICSTSRKVSLVMNRGYHNLREGTEIFDLPVALKDLGEVQALAAADIDDDGDLDLVVASGKALYLLSNTFEKKPEEANDRRRNPLLTVRAPGHFGALVTLEDKDGKPLASQRIGDGPAADTVYFGYRDVVPAAVVLTTTEGKTARQTFVPGKRVSFR